MTLSNDEDVLVEQRVGEENASPVEDVLYILIMESILNWKRSEHKRGSVDWENRNVFKAGSHGDWKQEVVIRKLVFPTKQFKD